MGLDTKYRPKNLAALYGNEALIRAIEGIKDKEDKPASYLLHGPRGCGKTTVSRILGKLLGAKKSNIKEYNISDMRGIDTARAIIEQVQYATIGGGSKVIILNEAHRATKEFQDAMLQVLEEPPDGVYFIICTTQPEFLLETVRSRCSLRNTPVKKLRRKVIIKLIKKIALKQGRDDLSKDIFERIAKISDGVPREALITLDTIIDIQREKSINKILGKMSFDQNIAVDLARAFTKNADWGDIKKLLSKLQNEEPETVRRVVLDYLGKVLLNKGDIRIAYIMENFRETTYSMGFSGIILASFLSLHIED